MAADPLRRWKRTAFVASLIIVLTIAVYMVKERLVRSPSGDTNTATATFVGRDNCVSCHREAYGEWLGSHHDRAMAVAADSTVLGDFDDTAFEHGGVTSRFYGRTASTSSTPRERTAGWTISRSPIHSVSSRSSSI